MFERRCVTRRGQWTLLTRPIQKLKVFDFLFSKKSTGQHQLKLRRERFNAIPWKKLNKNTIEFLGAQRPSENEWTVIFRSRTIHLVIYFWDDLWSQLQREDFTMLPLHARRIWTPLDTVFKFRVRLKWFFIFLWMRWSQGRVPRKVIFCEKNFRIDFYSFCIRVINHKIKHKVTISGNSWKFDIVVSDFI